MSTSPLHQKLRRLLGQKFDYLSNAWILIDILSDDDCVILQQLDNDQAPIQSNQHGQAHRRIAETLSLPISDATESDAYSEELILLLQGKF